MANRKIVSFLKLMRIATTFRSPSRIASRTITLSSISTWSPWTAITLVSLRPPTNQRLLWTPSISQSYARNSTSLVKQLPLKRALSMSSSPLSVKWAPALSRSRLTIPIHVRNPWVTRWPCPSPSATSTCSTKPLPSAAAWIWCSQLRPPSS